jgi:hypothetical protein
MLRTEGDKLRDAQLMPDECCYLCNESIRLKTYEAFVENNNFNFNDAAIIIKDAIVRSRYQAAALVNKELLSLYYGVGKYVSENSRVGYWGQGAIKQISATLQCELPGLRGFSEVSIKRMRLFHEGWQPIFAIRPSTMDEFETSPTSENRPLPTGDLETAPLYRKMPEEWQKALPDFDDMKTMLENADEH